MKIIYFTDSHVMGRNPGSRIDDYPAAIYKKFLELEKVIEHEKPDAVVHGGDFFHTPTVADSIKNRYLRLLRRMKRHTKRIYLVPGNHDLFGYSMDTIDQTAIGILASAGVVTLLTRRKSYTLTDNQGVIVELHGREYDKDIDTSVDDYDIIPNPNAHYNFLFSHGMLLQKPFHPDVRHTLTKDVVTQADLVLNGHYHPGYPLHDVNGTLFGNPGSTGRDEGSKESINRIPQYAVITADKDDFVVEYIEYQVAEEGKKVFDRSQIQQRKQHERYLEAFEQTIEDAITFEAYDPKDVLQQIQKSGKIEQEVYDEAFDSVVEAEQNIGIKGIQGYIEKAKAIGIKSVELENFQSHKRTKVEFNDKGLNAITGASDSGKSAIIRALRWVFYNEPKGSDFIRHGASRATVCVEFTDGSSLTRSRTRSSAGEYIVRDTNGKETEFKGFGSQMPIDIANTHQMPKVELSTGVERPLNFSYQLDGHFLLSESPQTRAATIGRLTGVHLVDGAIKEKSKEIRRLQTELNAGEKRIEELDEKLKDFTDIEETQKKLGVLHSLIRVAEKLEQEIEEFTDLAKVYNDETQNAIDIRDELKQYDGLQKAEPLLMKAEVLVQQVDELKQLRQEARDCKIEVAELKSELSLYEDLSYVDEKLIQAESLLADIDELSSLHEEYQIAEDDERQTKAHLQEFAGLKHIPDLDALADDIQEIKELKTLLTDIQKQEEEIDDLKQTLSDVVVEKQEIQAELTELFKKEGNKCPTCLQTVADTSHILEHM